MQPRTQKKRSQEDCLRLRSHWTLFKWGAQICSRIRYAPSTLRVQLNEGIMQEKSLQEKIRNFQSTVLDGVINPEQSTCLLYSLGKSSTQMI